MRQTIPEPPIRLSRNALVAAILADPAPVVLIESEAGTGKTWLAQDLRAAAPGRTVLDLGPEATGPVPLPPGPVILLKRPATPVVGLARAEVYGQVSRHGPLLFSGAEMAGWPGLHAATGGWACLIPAARAGGPEADVLATFLRAELLAPLSAPALVALDSHLADPDAPPLPALAGLPFVTPGKGLAAPLTAIRAPLAKALRAMLADLAQDREQARAIAMALARAGRLPEAMGHLQAIAAWEAAMSALTEAGGPFFVHRFGPAAFDRMLAGFPAAMLALDEVLVLCRAIQAIKQGEVQLMRRILTDRWGPVMEDAPAVMAGRARFSLQVRFFRLLARTWEDFGLDARYLDQAYALLAELPAGDDLRRGSFHNAVLEFYIRDRRFGEAEHVAHRAAGHYAKAGISILSFYIDLHRAIIRLFLGHLRQARRHAAAARGHLAATPYESPGDARLLALLDACIAYEGGEAEPLSRFLSLDIDALAQGEIWPTLVELTLSYGSQALSEHRSSIAARAFLDRWRVTEARSSQFRMLIDIREAAVIQTAGRWAEAAAKASALPSRMTLAFVQGAGAALGALDDRDEVALALLWLRHLAQVSPGLPALEQGLRAMLDNRHLTARQRVGAEIWLAHVLRRTRRLAQAQLRRTLLAVAEEGALAILTEERAFLSDLLATRRLREGLDRHESLRRLLRQVAEGAPGRTAAAQAAGLTRQEARVLHAIGEGAANKAVANLLGLSEATVKFHLANLYRKLDVTNRAEAVRAAAALRLTG